MRADIYCWQCMEKNSYAIRTITIYKGDVLCREHLLRRLYEEREVAGE